MAFTLRFQDEFTVGSDTALTSHTPTTAGTGYSAVGTNQGQPTVHATTDTCYQPFHGGTFFYNAHAANISGTWADDQVVEATGVANGGKCYPAVRVQSDGATGADGYAFEWTSNSWRIIRYDSNSRTQLGTFFDSGAVGADVGTLEIIGSGANNLKFYLNDTSRVSADITVSDATYASGGSPGIFSERTGTTPGIDDFKGYDQGGGGGGGVSIPIAMYHYSHNMGSKL